MNESLSVDEVKAGRMKTLLARVKLNSLSAKYANVANYQQQLEQYTNLVQITKQPTYNDLFITEKNQNVLQNTNIAVAESTLTKNILSVADEVNTEYIMNKLRELLSPESMSYLNASWAGFENSFKKRFSKGVPKDVFVNLIVQYVDKLDKSNVIKEEMVKEDGTGELMANTLEPEDISYRPTKKTESEKIARSILHDVVNDSVDQVQTENYNVVNSVVNDIVDNVVENADRFSELREKYEKAIEAVKVYADKCEKEGYTMSSTSDGKMSVFNSSGELNKTRTKEFNKRYQYARNMQRMYEESMVAVSSADDITEGQLASAITNFNHYLADIEQNFGCTVSINNDGSFVVMRNGVKDASRTKTLNKLNNIVKKLEIEVKAKQIEGSGLKKRKTKPYKKNIRFMLGAGAKPLSSDAKYVNLNKYMVNMDDLVNKHILTVKYVKNRNVLKNVPRQKVTQAVANFIQDLCFGKAFDEQMFTKQTKADQKVIVDFINNCHLDVGYSFQDVSIQEWDKQYNILIGEMNAGNDSDQIKKSFKQLVMNGIQKKYIPQHQGLLMLEKVFN